MDECEISILSTSEDIHFGDWTCKIEGFIADSIVEAQIKVNKMEQIEKVIFDTYFGDLTMDLGSQEYLTVRCDALPKNRRAKLSSPPGDMSFKVGNNLEGEDAKWMKSDVSGIL